MPMVRKDAMRVRPGQKGQNTWFGRLRLEAPAREPDGIDPPHQQTESQGAGPEVHIYPPFADQGDSVWVPEGHSGFRGAAMDLATLRRQNPELSDEVLKHYLTEAAGVAKAEIEGAKHLRNVRMKSDRLERRDRTFWNSLAGIPFWFFVALILAVLAMFGYTKSVLDDGVTLLIVVGAGAMALFCFFKMVGNQSDDSDDDR